MEQQLKVEEMEGEDQRRKAGTALPPQDEQLYVERNVPRENGSFVGHTQLVPEPTKVNYIILILILIILVIILIIIIIKIIIIFFIIIVIIIIIFIIIIIIIIIVNVYFRVCFGLHVVVATGTHSKFGWVPGQLLKEIDILTCLLAKWVIIGATEVYLTNTFGRRRLRRWTPTWAEAQDTRASPIA